MENRRVALAVAMEVRSVESPINIAINGEQSSPAIDKGKNMFRKLAAIGLMGSVMAFSSAAHASVVTGDVTGGNSGGSFEFIADPTGLSVGNDNQQSPNFFAFDEQQGVTLLADIAGIAAGTLVDSHYIWFDPRGTTTMQGFVTFDEPILAILTTTADMASTDYLGLASVNYLSPSLRGLESNDSASFMGSTINVDFRASTPGDYIRVLTAGQINSAVPEPATWAMLLLGFFGIGASLRKSKPARLAQRTVQLR